MMEQMVLVQKNRFGRSSEKMADSEQIRFLEEDWCHKFPENP